MLLFGYNNGYFVLQPRQQYSYAAAKPDNTARAGTKVYVINLDRSIARYAYVKDYINQLGLPVERVSAVDGTLLTTPELSEKVDYQSYRIFLGHYPQRGTIGCSLSHIKVWQEFLQSNFEFAIIFEDDVSFDPYKLKPVIAYLTKYGSCWDLVNLELCHHGLPLTINRFGENQRLVVYLFEVTHAGA